MMQTSLLRFVHKQQRDAAGVKSFKVESCPAAKLQVKRSLEHPSDVSDSEAKRVKVSGKGVCA